MLPLGNFFCLTCSRYVSNRDRLPEEKGAPAGEGTVAVIGSGVCGSFEWLCIPDCKQRNGSVESLVEDLTRKVLLSPRPGFAERGPGRGDFLLFSGIFRFVIETNF
jgi:hypothetical protein